MKNWLLKKKRASWVGEPSGTKSASNIASEKFNPYGKTVQVWAVEESPLLHHKGREGGNLFDAS